MNYNDIKRKVMPGDIITSSKYKAWVVKEVLSQDVYKDEDAGKYGIDDKSYIDLEFIDTKGEYHHWKSNMDGGVLGYREDIQKAINDVIDRDFKKLFYEERFSIWEVTKVLQDKGFSQEDIYSSLLRCIGDLHWED